MVNSATLSRRIRKIHQVVCLMKSGLYTKLLFFIFLHHGEAYVTSEFH